MFLDLQTMPDSIRSKLLSPKMWLINVDLTVKKNIMWLNPLFYLPLKEILTLDTLKNYQLKIVKMFYIMVTNTQKMINIMFKLVKAIMIHLWYIVTRQLTEEVGPFSSLILIILMKNMKSMAQNCLLNLKLEDLIRIYKIPDSKKELMCLNLNSGALLNTNIKENNNLCISNLIILIFLKWLWMEINLTWKLSLGKEKLVL